MQTTFGSVLATTDFSEIGDRALAHAFRIAKDHGARLLLLHVMDARPTPNPLYSHYYPIPRPEEVAEAERKVKDELRQRLPAELRDSDRVELLVTHGVAAAEIVRIAEERQVAVLVIASHGRTGLRRMALGSVAEQVIRHAHCPVLVIR